MAQFEYWMTTDLKRGSSQVQVLHGQTFTQDNMGNRVGVVVLDGGEPATLNGTVTGYVIRADGGTVVVVGAVDGNKAYIDLPESAYAVPGQIQIAIRLVSGDAKTVLGAISAYVQRTATGTIIDPGHVIPDIDDLLAQIERMEQGTAAAEEAAENATAAVGAPFDETADYVYGDYVTHNGSLYMATEDITSGSPFNPGQWQKITVMDTVGTAVLYTSQTLPSAQRLQAAENIDALTKGWGQTLTADQKQAVRDKIGLPFIDWDTNWTDAQKAQARKNLNAADIGNIGPSEASSTAAAAHAKGSYLIYDGTLYQATADIAIGDTLATTGTGANIAQVTGGAMGEVADLKSAMGEIKNMAPLCVNVGYIDASDVIHGASSFVYSDYIPVMASDVISYTLRAGAGNPMIAKYNESKVLDISASVLGTGGSVTGSYTISSSGYVRISTRNDVVVVTLTRPGLITTVNSILHSVAHIEPMEKTLFSVYAADNVAGYLKANGTVTAHELYRTTPIGVKLANGAKVKYKLRILVNTLPVMCVYSDPDCTSLVSAVMGSDSDYVESEYTANTDCYFRFCYHTSFNDCYVIFDDIIPDNVRQAIGNGSENTKINVAIFGDSIFGNDGEICTYLAQYGLFSHVYNCAFGGTSVSNRTDSTSPYYWFDGVSLWTAITTGTTTNQDANVASLSVASQTHWATIKSLDFSTIDLIVLAYGTNDYTQGKSISDIITAYNSIFDMIRTAYPATRILVLSPIWRLISYDTATSSYVDSDTKTYEAGVTLRQIADGIIANCKTKRVSVFDGYSNVELAVQNVPTFFDNVTSGGDADQQTGIEVPPGSGQYYSGVHLNAAGNLMYAQIIHGLISTLF